MRQEGHLVDGRALRLLARAAGRVGGEWWGRTERAVAGSDNMSMGESK